VAGFSFVERLRGTYYRLSDPFVELPITLDVEAHVRRLRTHVASANGRIRAVLLADAPVQGTLGLRPLTDRRIPYELAFVGDDGRRYLLRGEKDLSWLAPIETLAVLPFTIGVEEGRPQPEVRGAAAADGPKGTWPEVRGAAAADGPKGTWIEVARGTMRSDTTRESVRALARSLRASPY